MSASTQRGRARLGDNRLGFGSPFPTVTTVGSEPEGARRGRVVRVERGSVLVQVDGWVEPVSRGTEGLLVGDWVLVGGDRPGAPAVLEVERRRTLLGRGTADRSSGEQGLAANVDIVVVVEPFDPQPSLGRIERLLVLAWASGAVPLVVLTKADLGHDSASVVAEVTRASPGITVLAVSAQSGSGMDDLRAMIGSGQTFVLVGPSGAGKSTLVNALAGQSLMATAEVRGDGRGRHATSHRQLVEMSDGSTLIDTPGLRSVGLTGDLEAVDDAFPEIGDVAATCRFRDCQHDSEPGCAVMAAVDDDRLSARRVESWRKLRREAAWQERRNDKQAQRAADRERGRQYERRRRGHVEY